MDPGLTVGDFLESSFIKICTSPSGNNFLSEKYIIDTNYRITDNAIKIEVITSTITSTYIIIVLLKRLDTLKKLNPLIS